MLATKPLNDIVWDDIVAFCEQKIPENIVLDYKANITDKFPQVLSSFANTLGGIVLVGVSDDDSKPVLPLTGMDKNEGLEERITNIILGNVTPPFFPEAIFVENPDDDTKGILVIRIQQSHETPHATHKNSRVYVRANNVTDNYEQADFDKIEWLRNRRSKSLELRENLLANTYS